MKNQVTIGITGGHLAPALAVIESIRQKKKEWKIVFLGRKHAFEGETVISKEYTAISRLGIPFVSLTAGRLRRDISIRSFIAFLKIPVGFFQAFWYCLFLRPTIVVSFGGYIGVPVAIAAWLLGIPVITHEQTHRLSLSNKIISLVADEVLLSFEDAQFMKSHPAIVTGLPIRFAITHAPKHCSFIVPKDKPIILITGGTTGAVSLNNLLFPIIQRLTLRYTVIHQTGHQSFQDAKALKEKLPDVQKSYYVPMSYIDEPDMGWILHHSQLVIGRSGANTVAELTALSLPALLVPLPWSGGGEQKKNAEIYAKNGQARIVDQQTATPQQIFDFVEDLFRHKFQKISQRIHMTDAALRIVERISAVIKTHNE